MVKAYARIDEVRGKVDGMGIEKSRPVLITGCSTGIGRATAERLADGGWNVHSPSGVA
jgi:hypothetical protein